LRRDKRYQTRNTNIRAKFRWTRAAQSFRRSSYSRHEGAPNVVVILLDDIGFGAPSTFGGGINMPTMDALAKEGLRYTQFHTTLLSSPDA
jgi:hypothetical protein